MRAVVDERAEIVRDTLRFFAWEVAAYAKVADQIEREDAAGWAESTCCPVCEETRCDDGCPLAPLRRRLNVR